MSNILNIIYLSEWKIITASCPDERNGSGKTELHNVLKTGPIAEPPLRNYITKTII